VGHFSFKTLKLDTPCVNATLFFSTWKQRRKNATTIILGGKDTYVEGCCTHHNRMGKTTQTSHTNCGAPTLMEIHRIYLTQRNKRTQQSGEHQDNTDTHRDPPLLLSNDFNSSNQSSIVVPLHSKSILLLLWMIALHFEVHR